MLSIFATTEWIEPVTEIINSEDRLNELVTVHNSEQELPPSSGNCLLVNAHGIALPIDWYNVSPPYLLASPLQLEKSTLLSLLFSKLGNSEKAWNYSAGLDALQFDLGVISRLQHGIEIGLDEFAETAGAYRLLHNAAIVRHYGFLPASHRFVRSRNPLSAGSGKGPRR